MAKPARSPLLGYNHNVKYRGRIFHVQTEDSGPTNPHLFTHLYFEGTILGSKRHEYDGDSPDDVVRLLMQGQHKAILKELKQGQYDRRLDQFFAARGEVLEPRLLQGEATPAPGARALDLDGYGAADEVTSKTATPPDPLPVLPERPAVPGPGVYAVKGGTRVERPFERATPSLPPAEPPLAAAPPVVVIQPPPVRRTRPVIPAATDGTPTPVPVVVQRTVVVGTPAQGPPRPVVPPRTRRPAQPIPYVVKEGSHPHLSTPRTPGPTQTTAPVPPRPPASPASLSAPRTSAVTPTRAAEVVADKSLDEVILAYLAQGASTDKR